MKWKMVGIYWLSFAVVMMLVFGLIRWNYERNFSPEAVTKMIQTPGKWQRLVDDPCMYQVPGDPTEPDNRSVKIKIQCKDKTSLNTLAFVTVESLTVREVIEELFRINGVSSKTTDGLSCNYDMNKQVSVGNFIECEFK